jgi:YidC/Oxa1 family membrane protein insertase
MVELWNGLLSGLGSILSFFYNVIPSYGVAIILLTLTVRVLLLPLTIKQTRSMQQMQRIQPQVKELQRKHKGNRQKLNEELMKLYKEHQVNPLGGCLPLLLQLPVFFALYRVLTAGGGTEYLPTGSALEGVIMRGSERFLSMNLSCPPRSAGQGLVAVIEGGAQTDCGAGTAAAIPYYIMVALMVATTFYQQKQMQRASSGPQAQQMKIMTTIMPVFLGFISLQIAAGVLVYWVTTNGWQIAQQSIMLRRRAEEAAPTVKGEVKKSEKKASPNGGKKAITPQAKGKKNAGSRKKRRKR